MNFPLVVARRYLLAKKSHQAVNIITWASAIGVGFITASLVIVLSVFNGFEGLIQRLYSSFDPDIKITAAQGKFIRPADFPNWKQALQSTPGIAQYSHCLEEQVLLKYRDKQFIATVKGVDSNFLTMTGLTKMITEGKPVLEKDSLPYAIMGMGVRYYLGAQKEDYFEPVQLYSPNKNAAASINPSEAFVQRSIVVSSFFSVEQGFDQKYVLVPLWFSRDLLLNQDQISSLEIGLKPGTDAESVVKELQSKLGKKLKIQSRMELNEALFKLLQSEKLYGYLIVSFILLLAILNVVASMIMLIIEKSKDVEIIRFLGADLGTIKQIFRWEGLLIICSGLALGLILGVALVLAQTYFGLIRIEGNGTFVVDAYPVELKLLDLVVVCLTVLGVGSVTVWLTVEILWRGKKM
ncbi:MAG: ABC transporter permease [Bacteroidia bacterium]|nr:ABC transporter permease [Bacteroidia bacterium]